MKKIAYILAALVAGGCMVGCSDTMNENSGIGRLMLNAEISPEIKISRAIINGEEAEELAQNCLIWISNSKGLVRQYKGIQNIPAEGIWLVGGQYTAEAWAGDSVPASFDDRYFKGQQKFEITSGSVDKVNLSCLIANVGVAVNYSESVDKVLTDVTLTVGHSAGSLTWTGKDERRGYFMMNSRDKDLHYVLKGKNEYGEDYTQEGILTAVKPGTEYRLNVGYEGVDSNTGGAYFNIEIEETTMVISHEIVIESAPVITNRLEHGFDEPVYGERGNVEYICLGVKSTVPLVGIEVELKGMADLLDMGGSEKFDILYLHSQGTEGDEIHQKLSAIGIDHDTHRDDEFGDDMLIFFRSILLNKLGEGTYPITITAVDNNGKVGSATLTLIISDAVVKAEAIDEYDPDVWATKATLTGTILKNDVTAAGFNVRKLGDNDWTYIVGQPITQAGWIKGSKYTATLTDLTPGTTYEYVAISGDFTSADVQTFTTEAPTQLPNASFEDWVQSGKTWLITGDAGNIFWDSGNHGSSTMNKNVTTKDTSLKHSGEASIKLSSQFVGVGSIGAFAAGNVFVGAFLGTESTTKGILGWGRPWATRPKALKGYIKYTPQAVTYSDYSAKKVGDMDEGIVYIAITDATTMNYGSYSGWPQIVATKDINNYGFKSSDPKVIAYGEKVWTSATAGDDLIEFEIPLDYYRTDVKAYNIIIVASASRYGDYYTGGPSVMNLDDLELVY